MKKIKEIIRLSTLENLSFRQISGAVNISRPVVTKYITVFGATGLTYNDIKNFTDDQISEIMFNNSEKKDNNTRYAHLSSKFEYLAKELKKKHVTLQKLWEEYIEENPDGYSRSQFCDNFNSWRKSCELTIHLNHKAGEKMFIDFAGKKFYLTDRKTGEKSAVETFVAILPASHYTYVCATKSQKSEDWIKGSEKAFWYFGGTTKVITPDCYKSAVTKFNRYDSEINPEYSRFAEHYDVAILPARPAHPKDKALVENAVKIVYSRIYAALRNDIFYSIEELNLAILGELKKYNSRKMQNRNLSRIELFETSEKNVLNMLPTSLYEHKKCSLSTIQSDYHVILSEDKRYYSVPYRYYAASIQKKKKIRAEIYYTRDTVEIYFKGERIAVHKRSNSKMYTTNLDHIPEKHRKFLERLNPEKTIALAKSKGTHVAELIDKIISKHKIPEQSYATSKGFILLSKTYSSQRLDKACKKAIYFGFFTYKAVREMLKNKCEELDEKSERENENISENQDVRGKKYYDKQIKENQT